ncbi:MAG: oligosaccharide flippase family protein [Rhizobiaceae bacterium]|nr:oligosaccharide flippase family protein [Rhizobiaceae bacterium]
MTEAPTLRRQAGIALVWSLLQNWGGKAIGLIVFVLLARLLDPAEFGIASSAFLILSILHLVAEFGLGDALVQRQGLTREDVNLPFFAAVGVSVSLALAMVWFSEDIAFLMGVANLGPYLVASAMIGPLMTLSALQDAMYRRAMMFKPLALRTLVSGLVGGGVGVLLALMGFGAWALIAQFGAQMLISVVWLWSRPVWTPSLSFRPKTALPIGRFGLNVLSTYMVDFLTMKSVDFVILLAHGPAALGLYTVSSRLYQLLLQLLQASISSVGLSMLSKVAGDTERMRRLYERSASLAAFLGLPVFFGLAALAPEVNQIMFGPQWSGAEVLMAPLLLIGGIHCIQFLNVAYLTALGRPQTLLILGLVKAALVLPPLYLINVGTVAATVYLYVFGLLLMAPLSFAATIRALDLRWTVLVRPVIAPILAASLAFAAVLAARGVDAMTSDNVYVSAILLGLVFALVYAAALAALAFQAARENVLFALGTFRK